MSHKHLGPYIKNFREHKAIPLRVKIVSVSLVWITLMYCTVFVAEAWWIAFSPSSATPATVKRSVRCSAAVSVVQNSSEVSAISTLVLLSMNFLSLGLFLREDMLPVSVATDKS